MKKVYKNQNRLSTLGGNLSREIAKFIRREVERQSKKRAGVDFGSIESVSNGLATVRPIGSSGTIQVPYVGNPSSAESISLAKGRGLFQGDGPGLYK